MKRHWCWPPRLGGEEPCCASVLTCAGVTTTPRAAKAATTSRARALTPIWPNMVRIASALVPCEPLRPARDFFPAAHLRPYLILLISASDAFTPRSCNATLTSFTVALGCDLRISRITSLLRGAVAVDFFFANVVVSP